MHVYVLVCAYMCTGSFGGQKRVLDPRGCEPLDMGAGIWTLFLVIEQQALVSIGHLSSPQFTFFLYGFSYSGQWIDEMCGLSWLASST